MCVCVCSCSWLQYHSKQQRRGKGEAKAKARETERRASQLRQSQSQAEKEQAANERASQPANEPRSSVSAIIQTGSKGKRRGRLCAPRAKQRMRELREREREGNPTQPASAARNSPFPCLSVCLVSQFKLCFSPPKLCKSLFFLFPFDPPHYKKDASQYKMRVVIRA